MEATNFDALASRISEISPFKRSGKIVGTEGNLILVAGLTGFATVGDLVAIPSEAGEQIGEVVALRSDALLVFPAEGTRGCALNSPVTLIADAELAPDRSWLGRVIDPLGRALSGSALAKGRQRVSLHRSPPKSTDRNRLGDRLETGLAAFNTFLPLVRGQRLGLFAGSGVGKSTLLGDLCRSVEAEVKVLALIGERGREVRDFVEEVLGEKRVEEFSCGRSNLRSIATSAPPGGLGGHVNCGVFSRSGSASHVSVRQPDKVRRGSSRGVAGVRYNCTCDWIPAGNQSSRHRTMRKSWAWHSWKRRHFGGLFSIGCRIRHGRTSCGHGQRRSRRTRCT